MLELTIHDLEVMRVKLLSAVLNAEVEGETAAYAVMTADALKQLAIRIENDGTTFISSSPHALGDLLFDAIREMRDDSAQLN